MFIYMHRNGLKSGFMIRSQVRVRTSLIEEVGQSPTLSRNGRFLIILEQVRSTALIVSTTSEDGVRAE